MRSGIYGEYPSLREKDQLQGDLQGANLGLVAFKVLSLDTLPGFSSSSLPSVTIRSSTLMRYVMWYLG